MRVGLLSLVRCPKCVYAATLLYLRRGIRPAAFATSMPPPLPSTLPKDVPPSGPPCCRSPHTGLLDKMSARAQQQQHLQAINSLRQAFSAPLPVGDTACTGRLLVDVMAFEGDWWAGVRDIQLAR